MDPFFSCTQAFEKKKNKINKKKKKKNKTSKKKKREIKKIVDYLSDNTKRKIT